jgi:hypothetical protein
MTGSGSVNGRYSRRSLAESDPLLSFELPGSCRTAKPRRGTLRVQEADVRGLQ